MKTFMVQNGHTALKMHVQKTLLAIHMDRYNRRERRLLC